MDSKVKQPIVTRSQGIPEIKQTIGQLLLLLAPVVAASAIYATKVTKTEQFEVIQGPDKWVAFSANLTSIHRNGQRFVGRYYRNADGSTRSETGRTLEKIDIVSIKNIPLQTFYFKSERVDYWTVMRMQLPQDGWIPHPLRMNVNRRHTNETVEGFSLIEQTERDGGRMYAAPELNFFYVALTQPCDKGVDGPCGQWLDQIRLEDSPEEHFAPPMGAQVVAKAGYGGIFSTMRPANPAVK